MTELPSEPILQGVLWTWIVPTLVFGVAAAATWMLYRHFSKQADEDED